MINSCLFPGTHYVLVYFSTSTSLCLRQGTDIYNEDWNWWSTVVYLLVHTMCVSISLLALACAWDKEWYLQCGFKMMIKSCLFPGTHYVLVYFSTSTSMCVGQGTDIYNEDCKWWSTVAYFLVHTLCWCFSLLALACTWDQEPISTKSIKMINSCLFPGTHFVLVYFSTSTSLCLGTGTDIYRGLKMMINSCLFPGSHYVLVYFSTSTSLCLGPGINIYNKDWKWWTTVAYFLVHTMC